MNKQSKLLSFFNKEDLSDHNEPAWLIRLREKSLDYYHFLPNETSPLYNKYSGLIELRSDSILLDFNTNLPSKYIVDILNEKEGPYVATINSNIYSINIPEELIKKGVIVEDIITSINKYEGLLKSIIEDIDLTEDKYLALESALFNSGLFIYIPPNLNLEEPITIIHEQNRDLSSVVRNIIYIDESSTANLIYELYSNYEGNKQQVLFELNQIHLAKNSQLNYTILQSMSQDTIHISNTKFYVMRDARLVSYLGGFGSKLSRYKIDNIIKEEGGSVEHIETVFINNEQIFDVTSNLLHKNRNTRGRIIAKNILKDKARSLFKGMIKIDKEASNSESYLAGHAILLNKGAKADSIPSLEIENKEVKATHSASVAQIDEDQIFYLSSRGFNKEEAKKFIVLGFIEPILRRLNLEARVWTKYLIEKKWNNEPLLIRNKDVVRDILEVEKESREVERDIFERHYKYRR